MRLAATAAGIMLLGISGIGFSQGDRSLTNSGLEAPKGLGLKPLAQPDLDGNVAAQQERILLLENSVKALTESLAISNSEAEMFKRQAAELNLKLQALGTTGLEGDEGKLEQRLLAAVRDLRLAKTTGEEYRTQLIRLSEAVMALLRTLEGVEPEGRMAVETELRKTSELLGEPATAETAPAIEPTLSDGMVVDVRDDLSLVVANIGDRHGVKIGMPFQVWRDNRRIGEVRVVDVRERISGAIIQNLGSEAVKVQAGDRLRVNTQ